MSFNQVESKASELYEKIYSYVSKNVPNFKNSKHIIKSRSQVYTSHGISIFYLTDFLSLDLLFLLKDVKKDNNDKAVKKISNFIKELTNLQILEIIMQ